MDHRNTPAESLLSPEQRLISSTSPKQKAAGINDNLKKKEVIKLSKKEQGL